MWSLLHNPKLVMYAVLAVACLASTVGFPDCSLYLAVCPMIFFRGRHASKRQEMVKEQQRQLAEVINLLPDAAWAIDIKGTVTAWNKAAEELTGVEAEDIIGSSDFAYAMPFYKERRPILVDLAINPDTRLESQYESFRRRGDLVEAEIYLPHLGKSGLFIWARARRLMDDTGQVIGAIETVRDITERLHVQEMMTQTEKMAMAGGLAEGMAHEINNPLGAIVQNIQNIQRRLSPGLAANDQAAGQLNLDLELMQHYLRQRGVYDLLELVNTAGARVSDIVDKMMAFSHKGSAMLEPVKMDQLLDHALDLVVCDYDLKRQLDFRAIKVDRHHDQSLPAVMGNRSELEQAMMNLVKNAIQSLSPPREGYTPHISLRTINRYGQIIIEIEDNGCGMEPEVRRRVFEPFFTTRGVGMGAGLGLAVVYAVMVRKHHGSIDLVSTPGKGTKFTVTLPASLEDYHESPHSCSAC